MLDFHYRHHPLSACLSPNISAHRALRAGSHHVLDPSCLVLDGVRPQSRRAPRPVQQPEGLDGAGSFQGCLVCLGEAQTREGPPWAGEADTPTKYNHSVGA